MAAPTVVYIESTTTTASTTIPSSSSISSPAVGDLCVITLDGTATGNIAGSNPLTALTYTSGGADAGFTFLGGVDSGTATTEGRIYRYWKVLVSGDFSGSNLKQLSIPSAISSTMNVMRAQIWVFRHANGWVGAPTDSYTDVAGFTANSDQTLSFTSTRANVSVFCWGNGTSQTTLAIKWDGSSTAQEPYCNDGSGTTTTGGHANNYGTGTGSAQADYLEYDAGSKSTKFQINVGASSSHAVSIDAFQVAASTINGTGTLGGGGTLAATGVPTVLGTNVHFVGNGTLAGNGVPTVNGTASLSGGGTLHGAQQGATLGTAALSGGGTLAGRQAKIGTAALTGLVTLTATGIRTVQGVGVLGGGGLLRSDGIVGEIPQATSGSWHSGAAYLTTNTWTNATGTLSGTGTLHATGAKVAIHTGISVLRGNGALAATATVTVIGVAQCDGGGILHASGSRLSGHRATLDQDTNATLNQNTNATLAGV